MGQLITKLMRIFGSQGKGRTGQPSDLFDSAVFWGSWDLGVAGEEGLGTLGSRVRCVHSHMLHGLLSALPLAPFLSLPFSVLSAWGWESFLPLPHHPAVLSATWISQFPAMVT